METLDALFKTFFYYIVDFAKWIFAIKMATALIKNAGTYDYQGVLKELMNGSFSYAALYSIVTVLDTIKSAFN